MLKSLKVVIVDDSILVRNTLETILVEIGHRVVGKADNGAKGVELYRELKPDLVTMDITMPGIGGVEALKKIMEIDNSAKVMMVTSHGEEHLVMEAIKSGAKGYALKPIKTHHIQKVIGTMFKEDEL